MYEYGDLSLHEGILGQDPPCNGHSGYFLLRRTQDQAILFHVGTLTAFECPLERHYKLQNAAGHFVFDAVWKPRQFRVAAMADRLEWNMGSYDTNNLTYSVDEARSLLAVLRGGEETLPAAAKPKAKRLSTPEKAAALTAAEGAALELTGESFAPKRAVAKGPGVIETIIASLTTDWKSVDELADILVAAFPHKDREGMVKTIRTQLGGRITKEKGIALEFDRKGSRARRTA